jgi:prevent-host-death family protein
MSNVGAYEAKTHLPRLLDEVEAGSSITITRNGRPVARLMPIVGDAASLAAARILALRRGVQTGKLSMRALIDEGRR